MNAQAKLVMILDQRLELIVYGHTSAGAIGGLSWNRARWTWYIF